MNAMALKNDGLITDETHPKVAHADGKMKRKVYEKELRKLQVELCRVQDWVKGARSLSLTAAGITGPASNTSWDFAPRRSTSASSTCVPRSRNTSWTPGFA